MSVVSHSISKRVYKLLARVFPGNHPGAEPGLYHFVYQHDQNSSRIHLRIDEDGSGILIVNANRILHLNPTAAFLSFYILKEETAKITVESYCGAFQVTKSYGERDYQLISSQIHQLIQPDGVCPIHELDLETIPPFSRQPSAPYRMDLALSYRCNNDCSHCYNARSRNFPELSTKEWFTILDRLWEIGIPHIVFTGGEPTLREDLPELIAHAEQNGQITGINTNGRRLNDMAYVQKLVNAGLDHVQITFESHIPSIHDHMVQCHGAWQQTLKGVSNSLESRLFVMTNTTLLQENSAYLSETLDFLGNLGVPTIGLNALIYSGHGKTVGTGLAETALAPLLKAAREKIESYHQRLIWYTPTEYCNFDPMELELGIKGCSAARYNMCIEPNGDVLPCQSYYQSLGNLLRDPWPSIWNHDLSLKLRNHQLIKAKCNGCALLSECGGGCPLTFQNDMEFN